MNQSISDRIRSVRLQIASAATRADRNVDEICLMGVSKTVDVPQIMAAHAAGIFDFGENRVQELLRKADICSGDIRWHLTGQLQTNKVKPLAGKKVLIHALDRLDLVNEMHRIALLNGCTWDALVEVNIAGEASKAGVEPEALESLLSEISQKGSIQVHGLMTIAPYVENPEEIRWVFRELKRLAVDMGKKKMDNISMDQLSMGMSGDYEVAIEEGATIVRIGTAIFGERVY